MGKPLRTDYFDRPKLRKRLREARRGGERIFQQGLITIKFSRNFDQFAARTAHALRTYMVYRTDGGKFARSVVRASQHLRRIHEFYRPQMSERDSINIYYLLIRRRAANPQNRWVLAAEFYIPVPDSHEEFDGEELVAPDPKKKADKFIDRAILIARDKPGERWRRIQAYLALADSLEWPAFLDLWYYHPTAVHEYATVSEAQRAIMFAQGGGRYPLSGQLDGFQFRWRVYPFREMLRHGMDQSDYIVSLTLGALDEKITESLHNMNRGDDAAGSQSGQEQEPVWTGFKRHVRLLLKERKGHLYYLWNKNTEDKRGIFEWLYN